MFGQQNLVLPDGFEFRKVLGEGGQAVVVLALDLRDQSDGDQATHVGIKCYPRHALSDERKKKHVRREVRNLTKLQHPHIVQCREVLLSQTHFCIVLQYINGGSLLDLLSHPRTSRLNEDQARWFFQQLIIAVDFAHRLNVAHRDIKPDNIMLQPFPDRRPPLVKLCDFGLGNDGLSGPPSILEGTRGYVAPELFISCGRPGKELKIADLYSCGVCLFQMLFGKNELPFRRIEDPAVLLKNEHHEVDFPDTVVISDECRALLTGLLQPNPAKRWRMDDVLVNAWFREHLPERACRMNEILLEDELSERASSLPSGDDLKRLMDLAGRI